ncbi:uncharacterized protein Bfra_003162 [Botrytis fragariae]|uniref:Uncharacterized protein n=1 Tax=Botrytis fragariae TaxID=1964551 RepID=A0A8H6AZZ0_9HELO|nr:uncharacterized protein Bfra_003162 [Botrytis fragariae]KAF5876756.1 hypothetical protein Bfra_003162 [Botrytis fragariae]
MICGVGKLLFVYRVPGRRRDLGKTRTTTLIWDEEGWVNGPKKGKEVGALPPDICSFAYVLCAPSARTVFESNISHRRLCDMGLAINQEKEVRA